MTERQDYNTILHVKKDFRIWDLMLVGRGETVSKFNPLGDIHITGSVLGDSNPVGLC